LIGKEFLHLKKVFCVLAGQHARGVFKGDQVALVIDNVDITSLLDL
jgi:hypothetical protein